MKIVIVHHFPGNNDVETSLNFPYFIRCDKRWKSDHPPCASTDFTIILEERCVKRAKTSVAGTKHVLLPH
jgi:hypothetical protein